MKYCWLPVYFLAVSAFAQDQPAWVQKSNRNAQLLIDIEARYSPEGAARAGVPGLDDQISVLSTDRNARRRQDIRDAKKELETRMAAETDPLVRQDLQILVNTADMEIRLSETNENN